ncbi:uncharacterized protein LOC62_02G003162 [Vanrija pseudolonga]|uniref:KOW domain-containing protein n=1 Tax=Vanrija pseudolonga TaxID=143232 RepID=A0AAF0Y7K4_9TREE|nr:hypothetical protein LOC62_02G003162 [Vanrija pseudolonga]
MSVTHVDKIPKGLHHLEAAFKNKFVARYPARAPHAPKAFVQPKNRIKRWNIVPGDSVRLTVGKPEEKYNDVSVGVASGWKVYKVASVDMERNRVYLEGLTNNKSNAVRQPPPNVEELDAETLNQLKQQQNFIKTRRPVNYSNVQLCVEDNGVDSVFATRLGTSKPYWNRQARVAVWQRYAAATSAPTTLEPHPRRNQVRIEWPKAKGRETFPIGPYDTDEKALVTPTVEFGAPSSIPETLIPRSMRAKPPADQDYADEYVFRPSARMNPVMQAAMPLYLGEELSPRFSRAKQTAGYNERRRAEKEVREQIARDTVAQWEADGRDAGLEEVLSTDLVNLDGLTLRPRTRKEVREATLAEVDAAVAKHKADVARAHAAGMVSDGMDGWVDGPKGKRLERKRRRKALKAEKIERRLENLTLKDEKNQFVPYELR